MFFVYVLESQKDHGWYIGYTSDLQRRMLEHEKGQCPATCGRRSLKLIYFEYYLHKQDATGREAFLKSGAGWRFLKKQLKNYLAGCLSK